MRGLHEQGIKSILIIAGPIQVARIASEFWGIDNYFGSLYEVKDDLFTGKVIEHTGDMGKLVHLMAFCDKNGYESTECVAVGDGATDIPIFKFCSSSIAINYSDAMIDKAKL